MVRDLSWTYTEGTKVLGKVTAGQQEVLEAVTAFHRHIGAICRSINRSRSHRSNQYVTVMRVTIVIVLVSISLLVYTLMMHLYQ